MCAGRIEGVNGMEVVGMEIDLGAMTEEGEAAAATMAGEMAAMTGGERTEDIVMKGGVVEGLKGAEITIMTEEIPGMTLEEIEVMVDTEKTGEH